mgnify:CR=1 FL=1
MPKLIDMSGKRIGRLLVMGPGDVQGTTRRWRCLCDCGNEVLVQGSSLRTGRQMSCGCLKAEKARARKTTHGLGGTSENAIWNTMKARCGNPSHEAFARYGGRGIAICERWRESFAAFMEDMGPRPSERHTIERRDNSLGYEPSNCYWATYCEQNSNTSKNIYVPDGEEKVTVMEWARRHGVSPQTVYGRLRRGQPFDQKGRPGPRSQASAPLG